MRLRLDWLQALARDQMVVALAAAASLSGLGRVPEISLTALHPLVAWPAIEFLVPAIVSSAVARFSRPPSCLARRSRSGFGCGRAPADGGPRRRARRGVLRGQYRLAQSSGRSQPGSCCCPLVRQPIAAYLLLAGLFLISGFAVQALIARAARSDGALVALAVAFVSIARDVPDPQGIARRRGLFSGPTLWQEEGVQTTVVVTGTRSPSRRPRAVSQRPAPGQRHGLHAVRPPADRPAPGITRAKPPQGTGGRAWRRRDRGCPQSVSGHRRRHRRAVTGSRAWRGLLRLRQLRCAAAPQRARADRRRERFPAAHDEPVRRHHGRRDPAAPCRFEQSELRRVLPARARSGWHQTVSRCTGTAARPRPSTRPSSAPSSRRFRTRRSGATARSWRPRTDR